jgi:hypothetical protein
MESEGTPPAEGYDAEPGGYEEAGYESEQPGYAQPGDLSDALSELKEIREGYRRGEPIRGYGQDSYGPEYDDEGGYADEGGYVDEGGYPDERAELEQTVGRYLDEAVSERVQPVLNAVEMQRREGALLDLAQQYPRLREPETLDAVSAELEELAADYQNPSLESDPAMVRLVYLAHEAERAGVGAAEQPKATTRLETGAGPSPARDEELDPQTAAYLKALTGSDKQLGRDGLGG